MRRSGKRVQEIEDAGCRNDTKSQHLHYPKAHGLKKRISCFPAKDEIDKML